MSKKHDSEKTEEVFFGTGNMEKDDERDFRHEEVCGAPQSDVKWVEKPQSDWKKFPVRYQSSSSSCVAQTVAKVLGVENQLEENMFVELSALDIYDRRSNKPDQGMWSREGMLLGKKHGATMEVLIPSQNMTEGEMNQPVKRTTFTEKVGEIVKGGAVFTLATDIDDIASVIQNQKKAISIGINFGKGYNQPVPELPSDKKYPYFHLITGVDFTMWQGKKAIVIDDSWGESHGFNGQRIITEDWFKAGKITSARYYGNLDNDWMDKIVAPTPPVPTPEPDEEKPKYKFSKDLKVGARNEDVRMLQCCLKYLKFFPSNIVCTGYYGGITMKSVNLFQEAYSKEILHPWNLSHGTGFVGRTTRKKLNDLFNN